jgi:hypothetical protein
VQWKLQKVCKKGSLWRAAHKKQAPRKKRRDAADSDVVYDWMHNYCRVDTNRAAVLVGDGEKHMVHTYTGTLLTMYEQFVDSYECKEYLLQYPNKRIGFSNFKKFGRCKCIKQCKFQVCADEKETALTALLWTAHHQYMRYMRTLKIYKHSPFGSIESLMQPLLCNKVPFPANDGSTTKSPAMMYQQKCCFSMCKICEDRMNAPECIFNDDQFWNQDIRVKWFKYSNIEGSNVNCDDGNVSLDRSKVSNELNYYDGNVNDTRKNTRSTKTNNNKKARRELEETEGSMLDLKKAILEHFPIYLQHHWSYKYQDNSRYLDTHNVRQNEIVIQTDFAAQPTIQSQHKLNCEIDLVCVLYCSVVLHSPQIVEYVDKNGEMKTHNFVECDYVRAISPASGKGKDQDWFFHRKMLEYIIQYHIKKNPQLQVVKLWSDGCKGQFKCQQTFAYIVHLSKKYNITIIHRFAPTARFKGVQDKIGESAK